MTKREIILKTAMRLFTERGFHNTPTSLITKEAGVATGTLFHHFKNKDELINEILLYVKSRLAKALERGYDPNADTKERYFRFWKNELEWFEAHPDEYIFLSQYMHSNLILDATREAAHSEFQFIVEDVEQTFCEEIPDLIDTEFMICNYVANLHQAIAYFQRFSEKRTEENIKKSFERFWRGLPEK